MRVMKDFQVMQDFVKDAEGFSKRFYRVLTYSRVTQDLGMPKAS